MVKLTDTMENPVHWKREFRLEHGFLPYQHACKTCGVAQGDHVPWNLNTMSPAFECDFVGTDPPERATVLHTYVIEGNAPGRRSARAS